MATAAVAARLACRFPAGVLADRVDRRYLMLTADLTRGVVLAIVSAVILTDLPQRYWMLLVAAMVEGTATAVFGAAAPIAMKDIVPGDHLTTALSWRQGLWASLVMIGPISGGLLFGIRPWLPFVCDAASYVVSAALLLRLPPGRSYRIAEDAGDTRITAGIRWLAGQRELRTAIVFVGLLNLSGSAAQVAVVVSLQSQGYPAGEIGLPLAGAGSVA